MDMLNTHYFIALPIQPHLRKTLQEIQMKTHLGFFKHIVYPEDFHITVAFLGGADARQLSDLHEGLERVAKVMQPFNLEVEGLHYFGSESRTPCTLCRCDTHEPIGKAPSRSNPIVSICRIFT